ncbi:MAG TPA: hypothetical protein VFX60_19305 [Micromonospora sp.]|nr:hypothetical protein [Micromonospora sp.]
MTVPPRLKTALDSSLVTRAVQLIAVLALGLSLWLGVQLRAQTACQAAYNEASNASQRARAMAAEQDRQAQDELFRQVADNPQSTVVHLRAYLARRAAANAQRHANPIPAPPSQTCG